MNVLEKSALTLARASDGSPIVSTATIMLFGIMLTLLEAQVETLLFGERFEHWLDVLLMLAGIAYSAYAVWWCALFNSAKATPISELEGEGNE